MSNNLEGKRLVRQINGQSQRGSVVVIGRTNKKDVNVVKKNEATLTGLNDTTQKIDVSKAKPVRRFGAGKDSLTEVKKTAIDFTKLNTIDR